MSRNKKGINPVTPLTTSADFANAIEESEKRLVVIDIHQNWCGPCTTVEPIFRKAYLELEQPESRLKIYTIEESKLSDAQRHGLPLAGSCKPLFILYKNRAVIGKVQGADAPQLETLMYDNVPAAETEE